MEQDNGTGRNTIGNNAAELNATGKNIIASEGRSRYDTEAINLINDKQFLAWILQDCVEEFDGMSREEIIPYIEDVHTGTIPTEPGLTNTTIVGDPTVSKIPGEGVITYDTRFTARVPGTQDMPKRILVDTEIQNKDIREYHIETRAAFNVGRMLSEQMGKTITGRDYSGLRRVYSVWICTRTPLVRANSLSISSMKNAAVNGEVPFNGEDDKMRIVYLRLPDEEDEGKPMREPTELMTVLSALFSIKKTAEERMRILQEHGIVVTQETEERINAMCNLSEGIFEAGRAAERENTERERERADAADKLAEMERARADALEKENQRLMQLLALS